MGLNCADSPFVFLLIFASGKGGNRCGEGAGLAPLGCGKPQSSGRRSFAAAPAPCAPPSSDKQALGHVRVPGVVW